MALFAWQGIFDIQNLYLGYVHVCEIRTPLANSALEVLNLRNVLRAAEGKNVDVDFEVWNKIDHLN